MKTQITLLSLSNPVPVALPCIPARLTPIYNEALGVENGFPTSSVVYTLRSPDVLIKTCKSTQVSMG